MTKRKEISKAKNGKKYTDDKAFDWSHVDGVKKEDYIESDECGSDNENDQSSSEDEEEIETANEKRVRLAKEYLEKLHQETRTDEEASDDEKENKASPDGITGDKIAVRLQDDAKEASGRAFYQIAERLLDYEFDEDSSKCLRGHKLPVTAISISQDDREVFSSAKDGSILRWNVEHGKKERLQFPRDNNVNELNDHKKCILALSSSSDGRYLASGGVDKIIRVWDLRTNKLIENFSGHRDDITSMCFQPDTLNLFSGSKDRTIKHWNLNEMAYVETLFGHQSDVMALDMLHKERIVSCSRDSSVRLWKIPEETQLVFHSYGGSMDTIRMINQEFYCTGDDSGSISLWHSGKKKPITYTTEAHGKNNWIISLACIPSSDLIASGSCDGYIRLWKANLQDKEKLLTSVGKIPMKGYINALAFAHSKKFLIAGTGQEHRLGRWHRDPKGKNGIGLIALPSLDE